MIARFNAFRVLAVGVIVIAAALPLGMSVLGEAFTLLVLAIYGGCLLAIVLAISGVIKIRELLNAPYGRVSLIIVVAYCLVISYLIFDLLHVTADF